MHTAILLGNTLFQSHNKCGVQFLDLTVFQDLIDDRMLIGKSFEFFGVGRVSSACQFLSGWKPQLLEKHFSQLFW